MPPVEIPLDGCGCCEPDVPPVARIENPPGSAALAYRAGTHPELLSAMRTGVAARPALRDLQTRATDDPTVALLDAWAAALDVLTFYTERIGNEGYLRTATELLSLVELARTVGYERGTGRASETVLAFTVDDSPGSPTEVPVPASTRVASVPGPGEVPQTFETSSELLARPERNAMRPRIAAVTPPLEGDTSLFLAGAATGLRPGDQLLLVGRDDSPSTGCWVLRTVRRATVTGAAGDEATEVSWDEPLGAGRAGQELVPGPDDVRVYALRLRTSLFGANAPDWRAIPDVVRDHYESDDPFLSKAQVASERDTSRIVVNRPDPEGPDDWPGFTVVPPGAPASSVDLDGDHPQIGSPSWVVLQRGGTVALYGVASAAALTRSDYALSGKVTRLTLTGGPAVATTFAGGLRTTVALAHSERLELGVTPITAPVGGRTITLAAEPAAPLAPGQPVVVSGPRPKLAVADGVHTLLLVAAGGATSALHPGELMEATGATADVAGGDRCTWTVRRLVDDLAGTVVAGRRELVVVAAGGDDPVVSELAVVGDPPSGGAEPDQLHLMTDLSNVYDRAAARVLANVVGASHGETRTEILGGGDASVAFQRFRLAQSPLTHRVGAAGTVSSLEIRVDGVRWDELSSLALAGPRDRAFVTRVADDGRVTVVFGDGTFGARLPTGQENVTASYRVGTGLAGMLPAGRLTMLLTRPLGVRGVTNPFATGTAADPDPPEMLRENAPRAALTFDRVVSLTDFADFARATPGIAKASAVWTWHRDARVVRLTVAGDDGRPVDDQALADLAQAIRQAGDARQVLVVERAVQPTFDVVATLIVDGRLLAGEVAAACTSALRTSFGFEPRSLGQPVSASEVMVCAQQVAGVRAVTLTTFRRSDAAGSVVEPVLLAGPTEVLTIRPDGISLTESAPT